MATSTGSINNATANVSTATASATTKPHQFQRHRWKLLESVVKWSTTTMPDTTTKRCHYDRHRYVSLIPHSNANHRHNYHHSNMPNQPLHHYQNEQKNPQHNHHHRPHPQQQPLHPVSQSSESEFRKSSLPNRSCQQIIPLPAAQIQATTTTRTHSSEAGEPHRHVGLHQHETHPQHNHQHHHHPNASPQAKNALHYASNAMLRPTCISKTDGQATALVAGILWTLADAIRSCFVATTVTGALSDAMRCLRAVLPLLLLLNVMPMMFAGRFWGCCMGFHVGEDIFTLLIHAGRKIFEILLIRRKLARIVHFVLCKRYSPKIFARKNV